MAHVGVTWATGWRVQTWLICLTGIEWPDVVGA